MWFPFPRLGFAIAWGYHSLRQLRRLVEWFLSTDHCLRKNPRCVSVARKAFSAQEIEQSGNLRVWKAGLPPLLASPN